MPTFVRRSLSIDTRTADRRPASATASDRVTVVYIRRHYTAGGPPGWSLPLARPPREFLRSRGGSGGVDSASARQYANDLMEDRRAETRTTTVATPGDRDGQSPRRVRSHSLSSVDRVARRRSPVPRNPPTFRGRIDSDCARAAFRKDAAQSLRD